MKRIHPLLVVIALILGSALWQIGVLLFDQRPITNYPPKAGQTIVFGDSLTVGVGGTPETGGFVGILSKRLETPLLMRGISGNTTVDALARLNQDVLSERPAIVVVLLGGNDYLKRIPPAETFANLRTIIKKIQDDGATVLLLGVRGGLLADHFDAEFETLADESGVVFVPNVLEEIIGNNALLSDEVHPNDAGYLKIADKVAPALLGLLEAQKLNKPTN